MIRAFRAVLERDPAARWWELPLYPHFYALAFYRAAHVLYRLKIPFFPRFLTQVARFLTGIEIHPGARIGSRLFIDHGMGVVIGETCEIGDDVTLFQGVTLGGTGKEKGKRHPTLEDHVVVAAGAKVLGNIRIGRYAKIGANAVVVRDVPPYATAVGVPARVVTVRGQKVSDEVSLDHTHLPDPILRRLERLERDLARRSGAFAPTQRHKRSRAKER